MSQSVSPEASENYDPTNQELWDKLTGKHDTFYRNHRITEIALPLKSGQHFYRYQIFNAAGQLSDQPSLAAAKDYIDGLLSSL